MPPTTTTATADSIVEVDNVTDVFDECKAVVEPSQAVVEQSPKSDEQSPKSDEQSPKVCDDEKEEEVCQDLKICKRVEPIEPIGPHRPKMSYSSLIALAIQVWGLFIK